LVEDRLREFLGSGGDWERKATTIPGVFVLRMPGAGRNPPRLAVELNPTDSMGRPTKKRGLILRSLKELEEFKKLILDEKLRSLLEAVERVCGTMEKAEPARGDLIEL
jgi:hypothetical protein